MILRVRVGGGGRLNSSKPRFVPACKLVLLFVRPMAMNSGDEGDTGTNEASESLRDDDGGLPLLSDCTGLMAAGGKAKDASTSLF